MSLELSDSAARGIGLVCAAYASGYLLSCLVGCFRSRISRAGENRHWRRADEQARRQTTMGGRVEYRSLDGKIAFSEPLRAGDLTTIEAAKDVGEARARSVGVAFCVVAIALGPILAYLSPQRPGTDWIVVSGAVGAVGAAAALSFLRRARRGFDIARGAAELADRAFRSGPLNPYPISTLLGLNVFYDSHRAPLVRRLRVTVGSAILLACLSLWVVLRPASPRLYGPGWAVGAMAVILILHIGSQASKEL